MMLQIRNLHKSYDGQTPVLTNIQLEIGAGEIVCLLGPSGCGKTTLLRIVAGLEQADRGMIHLDGQDLAQIAVHQRQFGLMFQEFALFPHKSVGENVAFGLRMNKQPNRQIAERVAAMLALVNLRGYMKRSVLELSGGERQRVALARSLAPSPRLLMLDEPLGSLDRALREELMNELRTILKRVGVTALYVTHDQQEAFAVADRLVVMHGGQIEQIGTPEQVYQRPANELVARFLGFNNLLPATLVDGAPGLMHTPIGDLRFAAPSGVAGKPSNHHLLLLRPQAICSLAAAVGPDVEPNTLLGKLSQLSFRGSHYRIEMLVGDPKNEWRLHFELPSIASSHHPPLAELIGQHVTIQLDPAQLLMVE
jgi:ABC-type Fe3+/spermidine/putrescine transport system ATPase subunit